MGYPRAARELSHAERLKPFFLKDFSCSPKDRLAQLAVVIRE
jgi:hypothetical protein